MLPMFPVSTVIFPCATFPLHVFEPRYRRLTRDVLAGNARLGVVLIDRGSEVGGGDTRRSVGTEAQVVASWPMSDGRWTLLLEGRQRIRVERWLAEEPFPQAHVVDFEDEPAHSDTRPTRDLVEARLLHAQSLQVRLGELHTDAVPSELPADPALACWRAAALAPLGPVDKQRVLETEGLEKRLHLLAGLLAEAIELLALRLAGG